MNAYRPSRLPVESPSDSQRPRQIDQRTDTQDATVRRKSDQDRRPSSLFPGDAEKRGGDIDEMQHTPASKGSDKAWISPLPPRPSAILACLLVLSLGLRSSPEICTAGQR
ncbi:hypothetical protein N7532_010936 [Penicillium argentinense]|uniref:Uncharacterized protein n=1 Tax=Penicillium argentinense TaxID=1131581 RepID=A0A9W9EQT5_9EURO|nr:uncharacterized protein N7532_010936 [Penicillium argentinense]KAJ5086165.1 hypothetical protein N7532_010936 [Penicillium argentinense]